jgi:hypothetical protein
MNKIIRWLVPLAAIIFAVMLAIQPSETEAGGGIGSVWSTGSTSNSITIDWTFPSKFAPSGTDPYEICYKVTGSLEGACHGGITLRTGQKPYTITGLQPGISYKIKISCHCTKNGKNAKWRKVGTAHISTQDAEGGTLRITKAYYHQLDLEWQHANPAKFVTMRLCYKSKFAVFVVLDRCADYANTWRSSPLKGQIEFPNNQFQISTSSASSLLRCIQYKFMLVGFNSNQQSTVIDVTDGKTLCRGRFLFFFRTAVDDHEDIIQVYAAKLDDAYQGRLFDHLAEQHPELLKAAETARDDRDNLRETSALIEYLVDVRGDIFIQWQAEDEVLLRHGLNLEEFLMTNYPEAYNSIVADFDAEDSGEYEDPGPK